MTKKAQHFLNAVRIELPSNPSHRWQTIAEMAANAFPVTCKVLIVTLKMTVESAGETGDCDQLVCFTRDPTIRISLDYFQPPVRFVVGIVWRRIFLINAG
jgi:hypothetical protein